MHFFYFDATPVNFVSSLVKMRKIEGEKMSAGAVARGFYFRIRLGTTRFVTVTIAVEFVKKSKVAVEAESELDLERNGKNIRRVGARVEFEKNGMELCEVGTAHSGFGV